MDQQSAAALIMYINRAIGIVPTTGVEWDAISKGLAMIEGIANGRITVRVEQRPPAQPVPQRDDDEASR